MILHYVGAAVQEVPKTILTSIRRAVRIVNKSFSCLCILDVTVKFSVSGIGCRVDLVRTFVGIVLPLSQFVRQILQKLFVAGELYCKTNKAALPKIVAKRIFIFKLLYKPERANGLEMEYLSTITSRSSGFV